MELKKLAVLVVAMVLAAVLGFRSSRRTGIQPGYFEKQEAPAYGVSKEKPMGSGMGKDVEEYFQRLYHEP